MTEEENLPTSQAAIPEENSKAQIPISKQEEVSENILTTGQAGSPQEPIASTETDEQFTTHTLQPATQMEVHYHPKVEKKNFKEYLLEGSMIFLAVTMGFLQSSYGNILQKEEKKLNTCIHLQRI